MPELPSAPRSVFVLHAHPRSGNSYKPALMLALCGLPFEFRLVDLPAGEQRGEAFRAINRYGQVPALVHGDRCLVQSNAILEYLSHVSGRFGVDDALQRQRLREWLYWEQDMLFVGVGRTRFFTRVAPGDPALVAWLRSVGERALGQLETQLLASPWLAGDTPTIADLAAYCYARLAEEGGFEMREKRATLAWRRRIEALPGWLPPEALMPLA